MSDKILNDLKEIGIDPKIEIVSTDDKVGIKINLDDDPEPEISWFTTNKKAVIIGGAVLVAVSIGIGLAFKFGLL